MKCLSFREMRKTEAILVSCHNGTWYMAAWIHQSDSPNTQSMTVQNTVLYCRKIYLMEMQKEGTSDDNLAKKFMIYFIMF